MNDAMSQFDLLDVHVRELNARIPDAPLTGIFLCHLIMHLGRELTTMMEHEIRPFGLAEAEFRVLRTLFSQPECVAHPSELCMWTSLSPANMSRISDALMSRELITRVRSVHDRRRVVLRITAQGDDLVRQLLPTIILRVRKTLTRFTPREQRELIAQLNRIVLRPRGNTLDEIAERTA